MYPMSHPFFVIITMVGLPTLLVAYIHEVKTFKQHSSIDDFDRINSLYVSFHAIDSMANPIGK
jgi:hypothetical protein